MRAIFDLLHSPHTVNRSRANYSCKIIRVSAGKKVHKLLLFLAIISITPLYAQLDIGSDIVSRYIWRGTDFGNSVTIQPYISYFTGGFEAGAWSSWAISSGEANENDLYISYSGDVVGVTLTDYYFPESVDSAGSDFFNYDSEDGNHILEIAGSIEVGSFTALTAVNFRGDTENSMYLEGNYQIFSKGNLSANISLGAGNAVYLSSQHNRFAVVNMALHVMKGAYMASYILNPEARISWLVFGISL